MSYITRFISFYFILLFLIFAVPSTERVSASDELFTLSLPVDAQFDLNEVSPNHRLLTQTVSLILSNPTTLTQNYTLSYVPYTEALSVDSAIMQVQLDANTSQELTLTLHLDIDVFRLDPLSPLGVNVTVTNASTEPTSVVPAEVSNMQLDNSDTVTPVPPHDNVTTDETLSIDSSSEQSLPNDESSFPTNSINEPPLQEGIGPIEIHQSNTLYESSNQ